MNFRINLNIATQLELPAINVNQHIMDKFKYNRKNPPYYGELHIEEFEKLVDIEDFPKCENCGQPIYNPEIYDVPRVLALGMCGPCLLGEARTIMKERD